jgi:hypothetical protein
MSLFTVLALSINRKLDDLNITWFTLHGSSMSTMLESRPLVVNDDKSKTKYLVHEGRILTIFCNAVPFYNVPLWNVPLCNVPLGSVPLCNIPCCNLQFCISTQFRNEHSDNSITIIIIILFPETDSYRQIEMNNYRQILRTMRDHTRQKGKTLVFLELLKYAIIILVRYFSMMMILPIRGVLISRGRNKREK